MIFFPLQSKNKIFNNCTVTKKKTKTKTKLGEYTKYANNG